MKDIALDLGVSLMTVSKAIRNHSDISQQTRDRVMKRMRELDYQPDWIARSMVTRRTYLVGLVLPDLIHSFFRRSGQRSRPETFTLRLSHSDCEHVGGRRNRSAVMEILLTRKVDGLIIASAPRSGQVELF